MSVPSSSKNLFDGRDGAALGALAVEALSELQTPLEALNNLIFLAKAAEDPERLKEYLSIAEGQLTRMNSLCEDTLRLADRSRSEPIDLVSLADTALKLHEQTVQNRNIHLVRKLPLAVTVDVLRGPMLHAISGLIVHALENLPDSGSLTVSIRKQPHGVHFLLADTLDSAELDELHAAERLVHGDEATDHPRIASSRRVIQNHHGSLQVRASSKRMHGTVLRMHLPTAK